MSRDREQYPFADLEEALTDVVAGKPVILVDSPNRENEGDLVVATEVLTEDHLRFMLNEARGLVCVSLSNDIALRLELERQTLNNSSRFNTPFTVSVDHFSVKDSGVTASSRVKTIKALLDEASSPSDFIVPGNVFPLVANDLGVIARQGQTEGGFDLARLAGFRASAVICEILTESGTMARGDSLVEFAAKHALKIISIDQIIRYRARTEILVEEVAQSVLQTNYGDFIVKVFEDKIDGREHLALLVGDREGQFESGSLVPVRIHSECLTGDVFGSRRCDCGAQLEMALQHIKTQGKGVVLYLRQEGRGIGLENKIKAYSLQDHGYDTVEANIKLGFEADLRDFAVGAKMLTLLGLDRVDLLTNNPRKVSALESLGIEVVHRVPVIPAADEFSREYLETKRTKLGHIL